MREFMISPNRYEGRTAPIRVIVVHTGETPESSSAAEGMADWFSRVSTRASAHVCVDTDSEVRCVDDEDTAWAAPGANADGLQVEFAGRAGQTSGDWSDVASQQILERGAQRVAAWCIKWHIPARWLSDAELADGKTRGLTTHAQVSRVFKRSDHTDPGKSFPDVAFRARVTAIIGARTADPVTPPRITRAARVTVPAFGGTTRRGSKGPTVQKVQAQLKARGWKIVVDGDFGKNTDDIVRAFQLEKLGARAVDGVVGPNTWRALWTAKVTR